MKPTPEQITKLPKWAQEHIKDIERQLSAVQTMLSQMKDEQTPSPFCVDEWNSDPPIKRYVQSPSGRLTIEHAGVHLDIFLASKNDGQRLHGIELQYVSIPPTIGHSIVAIMPRSMNTVQLVAKEFMR